MKTPILAILSSLTTTIAMADTVNFDDLNTGAPPPGWTANHMKAGPPQGWSVARIATELNLSKPTLINWGRQLHSKILRSLKSSQIVFTRTLANATFPV